MTECVHMNTHICACGNQKTTSGSLNRHRLPFLSFWDRLSHCPWCHLAGEMGLPGSSGEHPFSATLAYDWALSPAHLLASPVFLLHIQGRQCLAVLSSVFPALGTELRSTLLLCTAFFSVLWIIMHVYEWWSIPLPSLGLPQMHTQESNKQTES